MSAWRTAISLVRPNETYLRGYPLEEISGRLSYTDAIALLMRGELPGAVESRTLSALFTAALDDQLVNPSAVAARVVASANPNPIAAIAAGVLAFGEVSCGVPGRVVDLIESYYPRAGESFEGAARRLIAEERRAGERIPGFGHPIHEIVDSHYTFRSRLLRDRIEEAGLPCDGRIRFYEAVHSEFLLQVGSTSPINVEGVMGAAFAELGYTPLEASALAPFTMLPGIAAHVVEEIRDSAGLRVVPDCQYVGRAPRSREEAAR